MKISKIFLVIFIILFFRIEAHTQCPDGYTRDSVEVTIGNCVIKTYYCYLCSDVGEGLKFSNIEYLIPNSCIDYLDAIRSQLKEKSLSEMINRMIEIDCILPCDSPGWHLIVNEYKDMGCRRLVNEVENASFRLLPCIGTAICVLQYKLCVEILNGVPTIIKEPIGFYQNQGDLCPYLNIPPIPSNPPNGWMSDCFVWDVCGF